MQWFRRLAFARNSVLEIKENWGALLFWYDGGLLLKFWYLGVQKDILIFWFTLSVRWNSGKKMKAWGIDRCYIKYYLHFFWTYVPPLDAANYWSLHLIYILAVALSTSNPFFLFITPQWLVLFLVLGRYFKKKGQHCFLLDQHKGWCVLPPHTAGEGILRRAFSLVHTEVMLQAAKWKLFQQFGCFTAMQYSPASIKDLKNWWYRLCPLCHHR